MTSQPQVASPLHAALSALYARIQEDEPAMANALKGTCQQMGDNSTWVGPEAEDWDDSLNGYSGDLASNVKAAVAAVADALAVTPQTCSASQARAESLMLSGSLD